MSSKPGNSGRIARRVISLGSARLRLLFVPVMIAWALLGVGLGAVQQAQAQSRDEDSGGGVQHIVVTLYKSRTLRLPKSRSPARSWVRPTSLTHCRCRIVGCIFRARRLGLPTFRYSIRACSWPA